MAAMTSRANHCYFTSIPTMCTSVSKSSLSMAVFMSAYFTQEVTWEEWLGNLVSRKTKLGRLDDKIVDLEVEFELLEKEEGELIKEQT